jgi:hypothetical protein
MQLKIMAEDPAGKPLKSIIRNSSYFYQKMRDFPGPLHYLRSTLTDVNYVNKLTEEQKICLEKVIDLFNEHLTGAKRENLIDYFQSAVFDGGQQHFLQEKIQTVIQDGDISKVLDQYLLEWFELISDRDEIIAKREEDRAQRIFNSKQEKKLVNNLSILSSKIRAKIFGFGDGFLGEMVSVFYQDRTLAETAYSCPTSEEAYQRVRYIPKDNLVKLFISVYRIGEDTKNKDGARKTAEILVHYKPEDALEYLLDISTFNNGAPVSSRIYDHMPEERQQEIYDFYQTIDMYQNEVDTAFQYSKKWRELLAD